MTTHISQAVLILLIIAALTGVCSAAEELKDGWHVKIGGGIGTYPHYEGSKERYTGFEPTLDIAYKRGSLLFTPAAVLWTPLESGIYALGGIVTYNVGRQDKGGRTQFQPGSNSLKGMGDIKGTFEAGIIARVGPASLSMRKALGRRGHGGSLAEFSVEIPFEMDDHFSVSLTPNIAWMDKRYAQSFFGVTTEQSINSGKAEFTSHSGLKSMGVAFGGEYKIANNWSLDANVDVSYLQRNITKSPVVERRQQTSASLTVNYIF